MDPITQMYKYYGQQLALRHGGITKPSNRFRPSEMHGCARAIFYRMKGGLEKAPGRPSGFPISRDGDLAHDILRWDLRNAGVELDWLEFNEVTGEVKETKDFKYPIELNGKEYLISGRCDGLIKVEGEWMPLEIKSLNGFGFKYILKAYNDGRKWEYLEDKYYKYLVQTMLCADSLGYDKTYLIIKDRSSCQSGMHDEANDFREGGFIIKNDPEVLKRTRGKMQIVADALDADVPPMHGYIEGSKECGWCDFAKVCGRA